MEHDKEAEGMTLSRAEKSVVLMMRNLGPFDKIEIKLHEHRSAEISITTTSTTKEVFPREIVL